MNKRFDMKKLLGIVLLLSVVAPAGAEEVVEKAPGPRTCTYEVYNWNVRKKAAVNKKKVEHPYSELTAEEKDPGTGCTVCLEDQELVTVGEIQPFYACKKISGALRAALEKLLSEGRLALEVAAYRPGKTKNPLDKSGNRLGFSFHAYGAAVDINRSKNGLYDNCFRFGPGCRLLQGGRWKPDAEGALTEDSAIVKAMKEAGFKWGGEIEGKQKDFMHFSKSGY